MPPHDDRADNRATILAQFMAMDAALRAAIVAGGEVPAGHPRLNSTIAENAHLISLQTGHAIRVMTLLADLASLDFDLDMAWFMVKEYDDLTKRVMRALRPRRHHRP